MEFSLVSFVPKEEHCWTRNIWSRSSEKCLFYIRETAMRITLCCHAILVIYAQKILETRLSTTHVCFDWRHVCNAYMLKTGPPPVCPRVPIHSSYEPIVAGHGPGMLHWTSFHPKQSSGLGSCNNFWFTPDAVTGSQHMSPPGWKNYLHLRRVTEWGIDPKHISNAYTEGLQDSPAGNYHVPISRWLGRCFIMV